MGLNQKIVEAICKYTCENERPPKAIILRRQQLKELANIITYMPGSLPYPGKIGTMYGYDLFIATDKCPCGLKLTDEHKPKCLVYQVKGIKDAIWLGDE